MKKIMFIVLLCNIGCAGLNHDMLANALNNADEQLEKERECERKKTKKRMYKKQDHLRHFPFVDDE
jgi:hypothetical protein